MGAGDLSEMPDVDADTSGRAGMARAMSARPKTVSVDNREIARACDRADWEQVVRNGGPPCFHVEHGQFCFRAKGWTGHGREGFHGFVSLLDFYLAVRDTPR